MKFKTTRYALQFGNHEYLLETGCVGYLSDESFPRLYYSLDSAYDAAKHYFEQPKCVPVTITIKR